MRTALHWALAITCAALAAVAPAARAQDTPAAVKAVCNPGADPKEPGSDYPGGVSQAYGGLTPTSLPGATTISVREAKCMMDRFPDYIVIVAAMDDETRLPNANPAGWAARPEPEVQARFAQVFGKALGGDKARPLIFYCHNIRCFMSYNAALRAVQAGFTSVYWMREGTAGWSKAGYAFAPRPPRPGEQTLSPKYIESLADCRKSYATYRAEDWAGLVHQMATEAEQAAYFRKEIADDQNMFKICMENTRRDYTGAADMADADKVLAAGAAEVEKAYLAARAEMEANPAKYLTMTWDAHKPATLKADLAILRNGKSLAEACGTFDLSQPPVGPAQDGYIRQQNARRIEWGSCIRKYYDDLTTVNKTFGLESANEWVKATRRFTCARNPKPNCIADGPYNAVAEIATDANVAYAKKREEFFSDERGKVGDLIDRGNAWIEEVNRRIGVHNASQ